MKKVKESEGLVGWGGELGVRKQIAKKGRI